MNYLIIGASIAGTTAAETIRSIDPNAEITLVTNENYPLYSRITVSSIAGGTVAKENLILRKPEQYQAKNIQFLTNLTATKIDRQTRTVTFQTQDNQEKAISYDKLLIATGGEVCKLCVNGDNGEGIFYMYNLDQGQKILDYSKGKKKAIVSGGAFIGIDFVKSFIDLGLEIDFLIRGPRFLHKILDEQGAGLIHSLLESKGVKIHTEEEIKSYIINKDGMVSGVQTNKDLIPCDVVGLGLGINRITKFIENTGLKYNHGVITNEYLQTLDPNIFAAGDIAEYYNIETNEYTTNGDWFSARNQGECAAKNMTGNFTPYDQISVNTINIFGTNASFVGTINGKDTKSYVKSTESSYINVFTKNDIAIGGIIIGANEFTPKLKDAVKEKRIVTSIDI